MANQRISQFTYTSTITGDELIGVAINGQNKSISVGQILAAADDSCKNAEQDKNIEQIRREVIQQEILVRETSEKMSALQMTVDDLYKQMGENNDEISSYVSSVCENISSYLGLIQKNTNLISYFHADVMRLNGAVSSIKDSLYKKNGIQDTVNNHTEQIVNLCDELHDLEQEVAYNLASADSVSSYLTYSVYPIIDDLSEKVSNLIVQGEEHTTYLNELGTSYDNLTSAVDTIKNTLNDKIDSTYQTLYNNLISESTRITGETDGKFVIRDARLDLQDKFIEQLSTLTSEHTETIKTNRDDFDNAYAYIKNTIENVATDLSNGTNNVLSYLNDKISYNRQYTTDAYNELNSKIDSTYSYSKEYITNSYTSLYNDIVSVNTYALEYIKRSYDAVYNPLADNVTRIDTKLNELSNYDEQNDANIDVINNRLSSLETYDSQNTDNINNINKEIDSLKAYDDSNTEKVAKIKETADDALAIAKENTRHISKLESDYVLIDDRLDNLEKDSTYIHQVLQEQSDSIHVLHDKVNTIEDVTIPNLKTELENADLAINDRIDKLAYLIGASNIDESKNLTYDDIQRISDTVIARLLKLEDETAHIAYHESHPETAIWGEWGIASGCGYKANSCVN